MKKILFMSPECGACKSQKQQINDYLKSNGKTAKISVINVDQHPDKFKFVEVLPTWMFLLPKKKCIIKTGIIEPRQLFGGRSSSFGKELLPGINDLAYYGKEFPNGKGFDISNSHYQNVEAVWGKGDDTLNAGVGGSRSLGPDKVTEMYTSKYLNDIRMAHPSDQLGTALALNRACNIEKNKSSKSVGLVANSSSGPQIVDTTTGFGRRRRSSRFGYSLYSQMGPAYEIGNQYLIDRETGNKLYSGARQFETPRPNKVTTGFIGQAPGYEANKYDISSFISSFGKKSKKTNVSGKKAVNKVKQNNTRSKNASY
jgi:hypothetical protein